MRRGRQKTTDLLSDHSRLSLQKKASSMTQFHPQLYRFHYRLNLHRQGRSLFLSRRKSRILLLEKRSMCRTLCLTGLRANLLERSAKNQDGVVILVHEGLRSRRYKLTDINSSDADCNLTMMLQPSWGKELSGLSSFFF